MFGRKKASENSAEITQDQQIQYHPELVEELIVQQSQIYTHFKSLATEVKQGPVALIEKELIAFKREFHAYLMDKNIKLFSYLKHSVALDSGDSKVVDNSRALSTNASRLVNRFIETYIHDGKFLMEEDQRHDFEVGLRTTGKEMVLAMRDERENLFPIYEKHAH